MRLATKRQPSASNLMRSCDAPCTNADVHYPKVERIRVVLDPCRRTQPMHSTRPFQLAGHAACWNDRGSTMFPSAPAG